MLVNVKVGRMRKDLEEISIQHEATMLRYLTQGRNQGGGGRIGRWLPMNFKKGEEKRGESESPPPQKNWLLNTPSLIPIYLISSRQLKKSMKYYLRLILPPMMEILYHVNKNIHFSLKKKHQDAIGEMSEQADQLHKLKARSDSYFMSKTNLYSNCLLYKMGQVFLYRQ